MTGTRGVGHTGLIAGIHAPQNCDQSVTDGQAMLVRTGSNRTAPNAEVRLALHRRLYNEKLVVSPQLDQPSKRHMIRNPKRVRPFLGAKDFEISRDFYGTLGFRESKLSPQMSVFHNGDVWFYLQRYYVKDWVDNTMLFLEVSNLEDQRIALIQGRLPDRFAGVRISEIQDNDWGREFFLHDPSGNLWHIGEFAT